ncbi:hypothetical protein RO3G_06609 [Rhizopus delemar RA 99-880]|uniref:Uncharacterized protein n=1 Tax=Rhizopus delemar (strain RA 99-880 / ATCC MYA-4621 / FGSC 9543 / NRRL 43880) TaxID=246409 RepID=I1C0C4_RHIO9|nr:hypothetical protein RO3G_06609 [Rhizopus delemar RA 99-880]|eukprot:EIE81904.1 hypothetical protein RO3G_06609 [Rhizopus delemar RA 99-880]
MADMSVWDRDGGFQREAVEIELHSSVSEGDVVNIFQALIASYFGDERHLSMEIEIGESVRDREIEIR